MPASPPFLNLVVIRSPDIDRAVLFYRNLGLQFTKHAHGSGPEHYSCEGGGLVFEIYPLRPTDAPTSAARLGFVVEQVDSLLKAFVELGAEIVSPPKDSPWGRRAVVRDLDGHSIELVEVPTGGGSDG